MLEELKKDKLINKYLCRYTFLSGSSTIVYPFIIWKNKNNNITEIIIQLNTTKNVFNKLIKRYKNKYNDIKDMYFTKNDGSCPSTLNIKMRSFYE